MEEDEQETVRAAMGILGRSRSPRKLAALAGNREKLSTEESRKKQSDSQRARRERERAALGADTTPTEKRPPGRPRKPVDPDAPKRPRGRPKATQGSAAAAQE